MAAGDNSVFQASRARTNRQVSRDVRSARAKKTAQAKKAAPAKKQVAKKAAAKVAKATPQGRAASVAAKAVAKKSSKQQAPAPGPSRTKGQQRAYDAGYKIGGKLRAGGGALSSGNPRRALVAEFLVCFIVLGAASIVAPQGQGSGIPRLMSKGTGLALLFLVLSLLSAGGEKAAKAAAGLGALVTAGYLFTSPDAANILKWITSFYGPNGGAIAAAGVAGNTGADTGAAATGLGAAGTSAQIILQDIANSAAVAAGVDAGAAQAGAGAGLPPNPPVAANKQGLL